MNIKTWESPRYHARIGTLRVLNVEQRIELVFAKSHPVKITKMWRECLDHWPNYNGVAYFPLLYSDVGCEKTSYHVKVENSTVFFWKGTWHLLNQEDSEKVIDVLKKCYDWIIRT